MCLALKQQGQIDHLRNLVLRMASESSARDFAEVEQIFRDSEREHVQSVFEKLEQLNPELAAQIDKRRADEIL